MYRGIFVSFVILFILFSQVNPTETYLKDETLDKMYFPRSDGSISFCEEGVMPFTTLVVAEGTSVVV